jgi:PhnB protein
MKLQAHLSFHGQCEAAFKFYEKALKGKITFTMRFSESPMAKQVPPDWQNKVIHTTLTCGDQTISGADAYGEHYRVPQGFSVAVDIADATEADRIFAALAENGKVTMPIQETFWAKRFGALVDQFGIPWMVNCAKHGRQ